MLIFKEIQLLPEIFLGLSIIYLIIHETFISVNTKYLLIHMSVLVASMFCFLLINNVVEYNDFQIFNNTIIVDYFSFSSKVGIATISTFCALMYQEPKSVMDLDNYIKATDRTIRELYSAHCLFDVYINPDLLFSGEFSRNSVRVALRSSGGHLSISEGFHEYFGVILGENEEYIQNFHVSRHILNDSDYRLTFTQNVGSLDFHLFEDYIKELGVECSANR